jgi:hypothetical protein
VLLYVDTNQFYPFTEDTVDNREVNRGESGPLAQRFLAPINKCLFWIPPRSWCKALGWNHLSSCSAVVYSQSPEEEIQNHWGTPSLSISFLVRFHIHGPENRLFYMNTPSHPAAELDYRDMRSSVWTGPQDSEMYRIFQHGIEFSLIYLVSHTLTRS